MDTRQLNGMRENSVSRSFKLTKLARAAEGDLRPALHWVS